MTFSRVLFWSHVFVTLFVSNTLGKLVQLLPLNFQNRWTLDSTSGISPWPQPAVEHRARFCCVGHRARFAVLAALVFINFSFYPPCKGLDNCIHAKYSAFGGIIPLFTSNSAITIRNRVYSAFSSISRPRQCIVRLSLIIAVIVQ